MGTNSKTGFERSYFMNFEVRYVKVRSTEKSHQLIEREGTCMHLSHCDSDEVLIHGHTYEEFVVKQYSYVFLSIFISILIYSYGTYNKRYIYTYGINTKIKVSLLSNSGILNL